MKFTPITIWLISFAIVIGLIFGLSTHSLGYDKKPQYQPNHQYDASNQPTSKINKQQKNDGASKEEHHNYWDPIITFINANEKIINATSTGFIALFTIVLAIATAFLYCATRNLVFNARDTAERQLRAYVFPVPSTIDYNAITKKVSIWFKIKNVGQTPAYNFVYLSKVEVFPYPLFDNNIFASFPEDIYSALIDKSHAIIFPSADLDGCQICETPLELSDVQSFINNPDRRFYLYGMINYEDIFKKVRTTKFCIWTFLRTDLTSPEWVGIDHVEVKFGFNAKYNEAD